MTPPGPPAPGAAPCVHVIDDDEAVLRGIALLLRAAHIKAVLHPTAADFLHLLSRPPAPAIGCVVTDLRMPSLDGIGLLKHLREADFRPPVIVMTAHGDISTAVRAMKMGAFDFIEKPFDPQDFVSVIEAALAARAAPSAPASPTPERALAAARIAALSTREREVLGLLMLGKANKSIALELDLSPRTVEVHRARLMARLGVNSLAEAVRLALLADFPHSKSAMSPTAQI